MGVASVSWVRQVVVATNCENVIRRAVVSLIVAAAMTLVVTQAAFPSVVKDPHAATWHRIIVQDVKRHPRVTHAALVRVKGGPLFLQMLYVTGAIAGNVNHGICTIAEVDARGFDASAKKALFNPADFVYIKSKGWTVEQVLTTYRNGVVFGCHR